MRFNILNRRAHLYLGLFLTPWVLLYAISSIPFSHSQYFDALDKAKGQPDWYKTYEGPYDLGPIPEKGSLRPLALKVAQDFQMADQSVGAYKPNADQLMVFVYTFWNSTQFRYFHKEHRIVREQKRFRWDHILTGMHARGGFEDTRFFAVSWSIVVDLVCLGFLLWIASGLYMWWTLPGSVRTWGWVAIASGVVSFAVFLIRL
ncbi:hypothetical protein F183_A09870 [Bryobacterales bacterium F-183]|nr:hypothetical protein F183_A09870 [Bryobacterales bacterium F-183]